MNATLRHPAAIFRFLLVTVIGLSVDLWTKHLAFQKLSPGNWYDLIPGWLRFEVTTNHGAVFGIGQGQRLLFLIVSVAAVAFLTYLFLTSKPNQWFYQILLGMLLAGVLGNVYDRLVYGYVRDMIHALPGRLNPLRGMFPEWHYVFPWIFNVADSLLCVGVSLMLVYTLFTPKRPESREASAPSPRNEGSHVVGKGRVGERR